MDKFENLRKCIERFFSNFVNRLHPKDQQEGEDIV